MPLEGESALFTKKPSQVFILDEDKHMRDVDKRKNNTSQHSKKKSKTTHETNNKDDSRILDDKVEETDDKKPKKPPKMDPPEIVERARPYSIVKDLIHTKANITFGQLLGNLTYHKSAQKSMMPKKRIPRVGKGIKRNKSSNLAHSTKDTTPFTCKAKIARYSFDLILDSGSFISVIAKPFLDAIVRKINGPSKQAMFSIHREKKKVIGIAKDIPVVVNGITIAADMEVINTDNYAIIIGNGWLEEAEVLINYKTYQITL